MNLQEWSKYGQPAIGVGNSLKLSWTIKQQYIATFTKKQAKIFSEMENFNKTFQDLAIHDCKKVSVNVEINVSKFARSQDINLNFPCNPTQWTSNSIEKN